MDVMMGRRRTGKNRTMLALAAAAALQLSGLPIEAKPLPMDQINYGPEPEWEQFREMAESAIKDTLIDPDSAKISWRYGLHKGGWKPFLKGWVYGYYTCGEVNSRNRLGGYVGKKDFVIVVNYDRVEYLAIDGPDVGDFVSENCALGVKQGLLVPLSGPGNKSATPALIKISGYGFTFSDITYGAYVDEVEASAKGSGLDAGMVITAFNGIKLQGLPPAVKGQLMNAATGPATVTVMGSDQMIRLERATASGAQQ
jgi:hypothetical protein